MSKSDYYVFVLWGKRFEEATAAIFVSELRKVGLPVKLVSLNSQEIRGAQGLALVPDLTLGQALSLAPKAICVVIPHPSPDLSQLKNDPRLCDFLAQARANKARFVIRQLNEAVLSQLGLSPTDKVMVYPEGEALVEFARELGEMLVRVI